MCHSAWMLLGYCTGHYQLGRMSLKVDGIVWNIGIQGSTCIVYIYSMVFPLIL
jgi:hypothetical protein